MPLRFLAFAVAFLSLAPSAFAWTTLQGDGEVFVRHETPQYNIELRCNSGTRNVLNFTLGRTGGRTFGNVRSVMLWIEAPDGRLARRSIDVVNRGQDIVLEPT